MPTLDSVPTLRPLSLAARAAARRTALGALGAALLTAGLTAPAAPAAAAPSADPVASAAAAEPGARTVTGVVQDIVVEAGAAHDDDSGIERTLRVGDDLLPLDGETLPAAVAAAEPGATVRAALGAADAGGEHDVLAARTLAAAPAASAASVGVHQVYVALVQPAGTPVGTYTAGEVSTAIGKASTYWSAQTGGQITLNVAATRAWTASSYTCNQETQLWAEASAAMGVPNNRLSHLLLVLPAGLPLTCPFGTGTIGDGSDTSGNAIVAGLDQSLIAHELGHNFGLHHSGTLHCDVTDPSWRRTGSTGTWPTTCLGEEYGDLFDVMGFSGEDVGEGSLNAVQLDQLGLLPAAVHTVAAGATAAAVHVNPISGSPGAVRAVKIPTRVGTYYAEYRPAAGLDAAQHPAYTRGVRILRGNPENGAAQRGAWLLDPTPTGSTPGLAAGPDDGENDESNVLAVNGTFTSADGLVTIAVSAADGTGADLVVTNRSYTAGVPATVALSLPASGAATATVTTGTGAAVPNWAVQLQRSTDNGVTWADLGAARTGTDGTAALPYTAAVASFRAVTGATTAAASVYSTGVTGGAPPVVTPKVTLSGLPAAAANTATVRATAVVTNAGTGAALPGRQVRLQRRLNGTAGYVQVGAAATSNASGVASVSVAHTVGAAYRFVTADNTATSNAALVGTRGTVVLRRPAATVKAGKRLTVTGTVSAPAGAAVQIQVRRGAGAWTIAARAAARGTTTTTVTAAVTLRQKGAWQVRYVLLPGTVSRWTGATSAAYGVKVS